MLKYPKSYKHFINWMYKKVTRLEKEAPNRFRILTSRDKNGNLECVMFADLDCGGGSFHKVVNQNQLVYYTYNLPIKFDRQQSKELFEKEFIALAYADHIDAFVPKMGSPNNEVFAYQDKKTKQYYSDLWTKVKAY